MRLCKRLATFALAAGMVFSSIPNLVASQTIVSAADTEAEVHIWDGTSDVSWYDDEDTEFHISTPEQLAGLSELVNTGKTMEGKTFVLDNDLQMNDVSNYDEWETTAPENQFESLSEFSGSILGNNHRIIGLYIKDSGLITKIINGHIGDLHLEDIYIVGYQAWYRNYSYDDTYYFRIGGISDFAQDSTIENSSVQGFINSSISIGFNADLYKLILRCYSYIGGIIGDDGTSNKIIGCFSNVKINSKSISTKYYKIGATSYSDNALTEYVGGICGYSNSFVANCTNIGIINVSSSNGIVGGICGKTEGSITNCKNCGEITGSGICGASEINSKISDCYNTGKISDGNGICGKNNGIIKNVYNIGEVTEGYGISSSSDSVSNAYYLSGTALKGTNSSTDTTVVKSEANMKKESFADSLGEAFYFVEGEFPKLAFEVGRTVSNFDKTSLAFHEFGETQTLMLETTYLGEPEWISSDTSVATVDSNGVVTAVGNGTAMIYALCSDSKAACSVTVGYDYYLSDNELTLKKGRVHDLAVYTASTGEEATDIDVEWSSSNDAIVSVDSEGTITTNGIGTAAVTAKLADVELSCVITVYEYTVPEIIGGDDENAPCLSEAEFSISTIESKQLSVMNYDDSVTWVSADTSVAKVSDKGIVRGKSEGNTSIYALLSNGRCLKAVVTVTKSEYVKGDVNLDGSFGVSDVVLLQKWLLAVPNTELKYWENADFYEDGKLDVFDLCLMKRELIAQ